VRPQRRRPRAAVLGAIGGALAGGALWLALLTITEQRWVAVAPALLVALLATVGAVGLGGRGRHAQVAAALVSLATVLALRVVGVHVEVTRERLRLGRVVRAPVSLVQATHARLEARLRPAAVARRLLDPLGLAAYIMVLATAWRLAHGGRVPDGESPSLRPPDASA
jgi:hypothetical protein